MIEVDTIEDQPRTLRTPLDFPILMVHTANCLLVLFTEECRGIRMSGDHTDFLDESFTSCWSPHWMPFKGQIVVGNKRDLG